MPQGINRVSSVKNNDVPTKDIQLSAKTGGNAAEREKLQNFYKQCEFKSAPDLILFLW